MKCRKHSRHSSLLTRIMDKIGDIWYVYELEIKAIFWAILGVIGVTLMAFLIALITNS